MLDIILETIRSIFGAIILLTLVFNKNSKEVKKHNGWLYLVYGFALIFIGMIFDLTDNFPGLNKFIIIGDTPYQAIIEKVVCYLIGFFLLSLGFLKWIPSIAEVESSRRKVEDSNEKLKEALSKVKILQGIMPICCSCKRIRDDKGYWNRLESYISEHSDAEFSHSYCNDCIRKLYPDMAEEIIAEIDSRKG